MRCSALAEEFVRNNHQVEFAVDVSGVPLALARSAELDVTFRPSFPTTAELLEWISTSEIDLVVWDSYTRPTEQSHEVKTVVPVIGIVDGYLRSQHADVYVDQNIDAHLDHVDVDYEILAGTDFAILSDRIIAVRRSEPRFIQEVPRKVLVAMGGTDALGLAKHIASTCSEALPRVDFDVIVPGEKSDGHEEIKRPNVSILKPTTKLFELISDVDMYLGACGTSVWEALYIGTPMACLAVADNQELTYGRLVNQELVVGLGLVTSDAFEIDDLKNVFARAFENTQTNIEMARRGQALVDGKGRTRIVQRAERLISETRSSQHY